jgi:hypothetical protein
MTNLVKELHEITDHSVFTYPDEIIVELRGETTDGEFAAITYQFEPVQSGTERLKPRDSIDDDYEDAVRDVLVEAGYELTAP